MSFDRLPPEKGVELKGEEKRQFVQSMFDRIARRYDLMNLLISLGQTTYWRKAALKGLRLKPGQKVLDVGCGTGWASRHIKKVYPGISVEGMDISKGMLSVAKRLDPEGVYFQGDVCSIPRQENTYDLVMTVFTLRNFPSLEKALEEMVRVTKPKGRVLILDTFPVKNKVLRLLHTFWLKNVVPLLVWPFTNQRAYRYMAESIFRHKTQEEVIALLRNLGCHKEEITHYSFGIATRILVEKS